MLPNTGTCSRPLDQPVLQDQWGRPDRPDRWGLWAHKVLPELQVRVARQVQQAPQAFRGQQVHQDRKVSQDLSVHRDLPVRKD